MSLIYSSQRSIFDEVVLPVTSNSVPQSPAIAQPRPVFRTALSTPKNNTLLPDDHGVDTDILTHKLQLYQLDMDEGELRSMQRKSIAREHAANMAPAARSRDELEENDQDQPLRESQETPTKPGRSRSTSGVGRLNTSSLSTNLPTSIPTNFFRSMRPEPLQLSPKHVEPQAVQSAIPSTSRSKSPKLCGNETKRHWRRTTISAGRNARSTIIMVSSPGKISEYDLAIPPVPQLSDSELSTPLPSTTIANEDQLRRELETFALKEGPNIHLSRRSSLASRRRMQTAFVPDPEDRLPPELTNELETLTALVNDGHDLVKRPYQQSALTRKKSIFSMFEKQDEVNALLDLYLTDEQLSEDRWQRKKSTKMRRHLTKMWHSSDSIPQKIVKPG